MVQSQRSTSRREDPIGEPTRHRRDASGRICRAPSSITTAASMSFACESSSSMPSNFSRLPTHNHYQESTSSSSDSSGSSEFSSSVSSHSRHPKGWSFWSNGKSIFSRLCKKNGSRANKSDSMNSEGTTKSGKTSKGGSVISKRTTKSGKHTVASVDRTLNSTKAQVREDCNVYCEEYLDERYVEEYDEISESRAVIKDSWDFFRMGCSLLRDRRKYDEAFRRMQLDPVYPYLDSMMGMNDSIDDVPRENAGMNKRLSQVTRDTYYKMSESAITQDLVRQAQVALPSLLEICKELATTLGIKEYAVGPVKDARSALRKAEEKYEGDVLKVTDFCRALIVVEDFPTLLALLELACDSFSSLIRRVKLSSLQTYRASKPGGYRDCIINLELDDHICEISVHLQPMWAVCGMDGFRHYRHCLKYPIDTFDDPMNALMGLDRMAVSELIQMAEVSVSGMPLETLEWHHEKFILDYFCKALLLLHRGLNELAESTFHTLIKLRSQHPDIGPYHPETVALYGYLKETLQVQGNYADAKVVAGWILESDQERRMEKANAEKPIWDQFILEPLESIIDPHKKERIVEEKMLKELRASTQAWKKIREERFKFLYRI